MPPARPILKYNARKFPEPPAKYQEKAPAKVPKQLQMEENDLDCGPNLQDHNRMDNYHNPKYINYKNSEKGINIVKKAKTTQKSSLPSRRNMPTEKIQKKETLNNREKENLERKNVPGSEGLSLPSCGVRKKSMKRIKKKETQICEKDAVKKPKKTIIKVHLHMVRGEAS